MTTLLNVVVVFLSIFVIVSLHLVYELALAPYYSFPPLSLCDL